MHPMEEISSSDAFHAYRPEVVVFVLSVDGKGRPNGMVAAWNMKCSDEPPLLAVAAEKNTNTHRLIEESNEFVIAVPSKALEKDILYFGSVSGENVDKIKKSKIKTTPSKHIKTPLLADAALNFECRLRSSADAGECTIFIGIVLASHCDPQRKVLFYKGAKDGKRVFEEI
jgi:flavin reductase (DIM6/NTAB) family NADH-FMN oxidoreductase RutF